MIGTDGTDGSDMIPPPIGNRPLSLDLAELPSMHPRLPASTAVEYAFRGALAFERHSHASGVAIALDIEGESRSGAVFWQAAYGQGQDQLDANRITEDGAEAVALTLVHLCQTWSVVRRLQRCEHADWLLERAADQRRELLALEVSGVDEGAVEARLTAKIAQVSQFPNGARKTALVVRFAEPFAVMRSTQEEPVGR